MTYEADLAALYTRIAELEKELEQERAEKHLWKARCAGLATGLRVQAAELERGMRGEKEAGL